MNSLPLTFDQCIVGVFTLMMLVFSFRGLNNCTKATKLFVRLPLVLFFTSSIGTLLLITSGVKIHWSYALIVIGVAIHLAVDRRFYPSKPHISPQIHKPNR
jgi:hypothetical protein